MSDPKKLFIKTYGCQMNVYDSERMAETMAADGYVLTEVAEEADLVLLRGDIQGLAEDPEACGVAAVYLGGRELYRESAAQAVHGG
ncbi:MAG: hypothetical protein B7Y02_04230, partial [Rhodobacterales bacterium 17-64-5]